MLSALILGGILISGNAIKLPEILQFMSPAYFHMFMLGWITQLIFGVAWWLFPRYENSSKGNEKLAWLLYFLLNSGLLLRVISEPNNAVNPDSKWAFLLASSAVIQVLAGFLYVYLLWPRVRTKTVRKVES